MLQAALGELAYSSEAAERLRVELRASAAKLREAHEKIAAAREQQAQEETARQALQAELDALRQEQQKHSDFEGRLSVSKQTDSFSFLLMSQYSCLNMCMAHACWKGALHKLTACAGGCRRKC